MNRASPYTTGWLDTSIHTFLSEFEPSASTKYALITCLDSNPKVAETFQKNVKLRSFTKYMGIVGNGVLLSTQQLQRLDQSERIFFGFDEVWFFSRKQIAPKPNSHFIVGPEKILSTEYLALESWLHGNANWQKTKPGATSNT